MKKWFPIFLIVISFGCTTVKVINYVNEESSFKTYKSFAIVNYKSNDIDISAEGSKMINEIESNLENQMYRRGYEKSNSQPDVLVRYELISNQVTQTNSISPYANPYYGISPSFTSRTFLESALLVEMTDINTKKMIWQASVDMSKFDQADEQEKIIINAISQIFDTYLYRALSDNPDQSLIENK